MGDGLAQQAPVVHFPHQRGSAPKQPRKKGTARFVVTTAVSSLPQAAANSGTTG